MKSQLGIFTTDVNLVVRTWDEWLERVTSRSAADMCGKSLIQAFPELESRGLVASFRRALEQGAVELLAPAFHDYLIECPPQSPSRFERMQQRIVIAPLREETGIAGLVVTVEDVTQRREREMDLAGALDDKDWRVRRQAIDGLVRDADHTSVAELVRRLQKEHREPGLLNSVLQLLVSGAWETLDPLLELAANTDPELRMYAALALGGLKDRRAIPALMRLLQDCDANVKYHAIEALSKLKASEAVEELAGIAASGQFFVAFPALEALASIGDSRVAAKLAPLLENEMLRAPAAEALAKLGDETVVGFIVPLMERPGLVPTVAQALTTLHQRYENDYCEGEHIADLVRRNTSAAAAQNMLDSLNTVTGDTLRAVVRVLGWVGSERVGAALTYLLGSPAVRSEVIETLVRHGRQVTEPLCHQLQSEDFEARRAAITALGRIGNPRTVPALIRALRDPELTVEAAGALARIGDGRAYEPLLQLLHHDRGAVRQAAVGALNSLGHPMMARDVQRLLVDSNPHVRESAVRIAGYFGYAECARLLLERVHDPDDSVRRAAVENLPNIQDNRVVPVLMDAIRDTSPNIRTAAAQSLGYIDSPAGLAELMRALHDSDPWVRYYAARSLGQLRNAEAIGALVPVVRNDSANHVRIAAAEALGSIGGGRTVSILAPLVDSEDPDLARAALMALGGIGHPDALNPILTILRSDGPRRLDAVRAISMRGDREAVEALQWTAGVDMDPAVCNAAIEGLSQSATQESIAALVRLTADRRLRELAVAAIARLGSVHIERVAAGLSSPQMEVRRALIDALGRMKHPTASDVLSKGLNDEQPEVRLAAVVALRRLGTQAFERKLLLMAHTDPDLGVRKAAEQALKR